MIVLNTLDSLVDDLLLIIRNSNIVESENINRLQIKQWIQHYTVELIKQDIDKDKDINPMYITSLDNIHLEVNNLNTGSRNLIMSSTNKLPRLMDLNHRYGLLTVTDINGNVIQIGDSKKSKYQSSRRFTCNDYIAFIKNDHLIISGPNLIETVAIEAVFENHSELDLNGCINEETPIRLSLDKIGALKKLILQTELGIMTSRPTDTINNSKNDVLNARQEV